MSLPAYKFNIGDYVYYPNCDNHDIITARKNLNGYNEYRLSHTKYIWYHEDNLKLYTSISPNELTTDNCVDLITLLSNFNYKDHIFYSPLYGSCKVEIHASNDAIRVYSIYDGTYMDLNRYGYIYASEGECLIYPSKNERDWEKWKNKNLTYKTWSDLFGTLPKDYIIHMNKVGSPLEKMATSIFKIKTLIDYSYGGSVDYRKIENSIIYIIIPKIGYIEGEAVCIDYTVRPVKSDMAFANILRFNTKEYAEEFLSYEENRKLVREYFNVDNR